MFILVTKRRYFTKLFVISFLLFFLQCSVSKGNVPKSSPVNSNQKTATAQKNNKKEKMENTQENKLKYQIDLKLSENDSIEISYTIENTGEEDFLVFNMCDTNKGLGDKMVYLHPVGGNLVELSQKRFLKPANSNCPNFEIPVEAGANWLKAKQKIKNTVSVNLPLKLNTSFDQCKPKPKMPKETKVVKFCLGVAEANSAKVSVNDRGYV